MRRWGKALTAGAKLSAAEGERKARRQLRARWAGALRAGGAGPAGPSGRSGGGCWSKGGEGSWAGAGAGPREKKVMQAECEEGEEMEGIFLFLFINKIFKLIFKTFLKSFSI